MEYFLCRNPFVTIGKMNIPTVFTGNAPKNMSTLFGNLYYLPKVLPTITAMGSKKILLQDSSPLSVPQIFTTTYWTAFFLTAFSPKVAEYPMNTGIFI